MFLSDYTYDFEPTDGGSRPYMMFRRQRMSLQCSMRVLVLLNRGPNGVFYYTL